ncbi:MAG: bifunctional aminoglycoside phosphotransferase/ATP-binding protein [Planctomycetaceae bacterium]
MIANFIAQLSKLSAYPAPVDAVDVLQTHISVVFLAGDFAYKLKKPVRLSFLDFSTPELRRHYCEEEVRLNRRLAPDVYLGVVPVVRDGERLRFEAAGEPIDWAVKMRRLPDRATLESRVAHGEIDARHVVSLAGRLAEFHRRAASNEQIASFGRFDAVARNLRDNFTVAAPHVGRTVSPAVFARTRALTDQALEVLKPLIEARAARGVPRDTHGDLHLDHVYLFPERPPPEDLIAVDCIEFNERFRYTDPIADMAFLAMDLQFHGRWDLAQSFSEAYFAASGDTDGRRLLPLYLSYRAAVRGKVDGLQLDEPEIPAAAKEKALVRGRGHWLLALGNLAPPTERPCLVLVGGLPGTGKSTLARQLAEQGGFEVIRSDVVRKELAGVAPGNSAATVPGGGLYTAEWNDRTYAECRRRAEELLFAGRRVIVDATFIDESRRQAFVETAIRWGAPALFLVCEADPETIKSRLAARRGDASDADWKVYEHAAARWEEPSGAVARVCRRVSTNAADTASEKSLQHLRAAGLVG